jgi:hypothetical protein
MKKDIKQVRKFMWINANQLHQCDIVRHRIWHDQIEDMSKTIHDIKYKIKLLKEEDEVDFWKEEIEERMYDM